jgi:hypothetical protein
MVGEEKPLRLPFSTTHFAEKISLAYKYLCQLFLVLIYTRVFFEKFLLQNAVVSERSKSCSNVSERRFCSTENYGG